MDPALVAYDTAPLDQVVCEGRYEVTRESIARFRRLMGYGKATSDVTPAPSSMGLIYGLRLGWEFGVFPPGAIRMGDDDRFGVGVRAGDVLLTRLRIVEKFERKNRKFMRYEMTTLNQGDELVCSVAFTAIVP
ncbi:hypothetical protein [Bosea sp. (in: a-proteobacteria)]|uniref:hypothetical protein n=1 Tax=Bosea sp. (in: a-proteobacteria) TaxID=1871050 RepID=UPI003B3B5478